MFENLECKDCGSSSFVEIDDELLMCEYCKGIIKKKTTKNKTNEDMVIKAVETEQQENKKTTKNFVLMKFLLCVFLGEFGVHRFVEGKIVSGIIFAITGGIFGIGYLCDIVRLAKEVANVYKEGENND